MTATAIIKNLANSVLAPFNAHIQPLTQERAEIARLLTLEKSGQFSAPVYPVLEQVARCDPAEILAATQRYRKITDQFLSERTNRFSYMNEYFSSPDAEVAYALVRELKPRHIIEAGSGNTTYLFRQAIEDGAMDTQLISIDPSPRREITEVADRIVNKRVEDVPASWIRETLGSDGVLFVDSSHEVRAGNDVVSLILKIIPTLSKGVVIHFHDIYLPYEYPRDLMLEHRWSRDWNEQYILQAMLQGSNQFEVLWPGNYLEQTLPGFSKHFAHKASRPGSSFWMRKIA